MLRPYRSQESNPFLEGVSLSIDVLTTLAVAIKGSDCAPRSAKGDRVKDTHRIYHGIVSTDSCAS
ncbi:hypothetical protein H6G06_15095 [Anabaena sphaerica FACHB-251]|uniref:Uncharacterized protein n=1 Tax=Anabaena sphaerica FACHB-251 TaxID=2692883 RepID=A0A927A1W6_9NOST|nr:hypothetical protein [Anabaena sphaerica FACHB-251]